MIAEDTILFQVDDHHHCSLTIYASEVDFNKERPSVLEERKRNHDEGAQIIEENVGLYLGQMSTVWLLLRSRARKAEVSINMCR